VSRFPYAILEIKLKDDGNRRRPSWVEDLMGSHLVHQAPRFSKFVHGVASLFEDYVNILPFWLGDLETDIRKDPKAAFEEEEQRRAQRAENEQVVGSFLGTKVSSFKPSRSSPIGKSYLGERMAAESSQAAAARSLPRISPSAVPADPEEGESSEVNGNQNYGTISSVIPGFSSSDYSRAKKAREAALPAGVVEPKEWIKNSGPLQIEPKVWLANERTFLKWQHICVLLGSLAIALYTAGGENILAMSMGIAYISIAIFAGGWGYWLQRKRRAMIMQRSGKDFDFLAGPLIISAALMLALILNFVFAVSSSSHHVSALQVSHLTPQAPYLSDNFTNQVLVSCCFRAVG
jgi:hypothetical protein